jgi:hypothetical protein
MKVMCIESKWGSDWETRDSSKPCYGEVCTVTDTKEIRPFGECYELVGYDGYFTKGGFIPISDIDETEFVRDFITEKV